MGKLVYGSQELLKFHFLKKIVETVERAKDNVSKNLTKISKYCMTNEVMFKLLDKNDVSMFIQELRLFDISVHQDNSYDYIFIDSKNEKLWDYITDHQLTFEFKNDTIYTSTLDG